MYGDVAVDDDANECIRTCVRMDRLRCSVFDKRRHEPVACHPIPRPERAIQRHEVTYGSSMPQLDADVG
jgi:hypothetical protein